MAKTPDAAEHFVEALAPAATARAAREAKDIQALILSQNGSPASLKLEPWDWNFYQEQVRKARYDLDEAQVKQYFELNNVLENGVFYAAHMLYGLTFKERHDLPVYQPDVRVFEVFNADGYAAGALLLRLLQTRQQERRRVDGQFWFNNRSCWANLPVVYNVANFDKPAPGEPALISFDDVTTMFHEFGHGLHGMFADTNVSQPFRHADGARLCRVPLAVQRALGSLSRGVHALRAQLQDRRAHAGGTGGKTQKGADL